MGVQEMDSLVELGALPVLADAAVDKGVAVLARTAQVDVAQLADIF
jgi:hypothetical protein